MEEMKSNQQEELVEQRPSTKYGRTAYQEQLRKEQAAQGNRNVENPQQRLYSQQNLYPQQDWQSRYREYAPYKETKAEVKNTFAYILMALVAITALVNYGVSMITLDAFKQLQTLDVTGVLDLLAESSEFTVLTYVGDMVFWVTVVILVLDIMALYKANYKITGAILFAIFLRPVYFIWRAHLLGQKKLAGIIYAVCYYCFCMIEYIAIFLAAFELVVMFGY